MPPARILPIIVFAQFAGTSLWFAGNAVLPELKQSLGLQQEALGLLTSAVQLGFIAGTLCFAILSLADRVSPRLLFLICALLGALTNAMVLFTASSLTGVLLLRALTGFLLAGIYPVGMRIAASWYSSRLGEAIGYLVGALVLGTAFPHLLRAVGADFEWQSMLLLVSVLAAGGGILLFLFVPNGPHMTKGAKFKIRNLFHVFSAREFKGAAFGYFGHMWELYTFWAFIPVILLFALPELSSAEISFWSFAIIAAGAVGCVGGGYLSKRWGSGRVAFIQLLLSGICCLLSYFLLAPQEEQYWILAFLIFWGIVVAGDSPQFSALTAKTAPAHLVGTALTMVTCIGFAISIVSIQLMSFAVRYFELQHVLSSLFIGPVLGLVVLYKLALKPSATKKPVL